MTKKRAAIISEKYLEVLKQIGDWTTVSAWATKFGELHPDLLEKANKEALHQKRPSTGLREIAARISSNISRGAYFGSIEVDETERPRRVRFLPSDKVDEHLQKEIEEDIEPLTRVQRIKADLLNLSTQEAYRVDELEGIAASLNSYFRLDFEVDHAQAVLNKKDPGKHHPNNLQILLKTHNRMKNNSNWPRFTLEDQIEYIRAVIKVQGIVAKKMEVDLEENVIESIIERLKLVYS